MPEKTIHNIDEPEGHDPVSPRQVAPWHEVELEDQLDRRQLVRDLIHEHPDATADDIARLVANRQIEVSSTLILQELQCKNVHPKAAPSAMPGKPDA